MIIAETIKEVKSKKSAKFNESIEAHFKLKPTKEAKKDLKFLFKMPHLYGKEPVILALCEKPDETRKAGAKHAGGEDLVEKIKKGKVDFDVIVAEPKMMQLLKPLAKDLGRAGKMPNDKAGTLTNKVAEAVKEIREGRREIRSDEFGGIHIMVGKMDTKESEIEENIEEIKKAIQNLRPIESLFLCSTMGKAVKVSLTGK
ncbi:MAG: 50S ribosomal protein L1 [Candidatus Azambacteria bacterium]|nr:50S ribosomal protein L1 [Candidatus Azambacteria bacterium]